ncbi:MAG TPA: hypothetical protein PK970_13970 [Hyphomicrobiaceae bacterium]|nr:hypothetical protein [Hyphomicrobiaceae bacterium]
MWRAITFPFRLLGRLVVLGVAHLLFALGCILLVGFLTASSPYHLADAEGVVVEVRDYCVAEKLDGTTRSTRASGYCDQFAEQLNSNPTSYDGHPWTREPFARVRYRDDQGRESVRAARASELQIAPDVQAGDRVRFKAQTKRRNWQQWRSDWYDSLPWLGIMIGSLLASAVLWTWGGGWRLMTRINHRETRVPVAKFKLAMLAAGFIAWVLHWAWRRVEHTRFGKSAARILRDASRP